MLVLFMGTKMFIWTEKARKV